tara:strand:- start:224 stop:679 length:456 start_codon:yes stop_codon:yes gene_type:complete
MNDIIAKLYGDPSKGTPIDVPYTSSFGYYNNIPEPVSAPVHPIIAALYGDPSQGTPVDVPYTSSFQYYNDLNNQQEQVSQETTQVSSTAPATPTSPTADQVVRTAPSGVLSGNQFAAAPLRELGFLTNKEKPQYMKMLNQALLGSLFKDLL